MRDGQSYTLDIVMALAIVVLLLTFLTTFNFGSSNSFTDEDANLLAAAIFNPYPVSWNQTTVIVPGFVIDHRLSESLLDNFSSLPEYEVVELTGIRSEYFINITADYGIVREVGTPPVDAETIHAIKRLAAFNNTLVTIEVIAWE